MSKKSNLKKADNGFTLHWDAKLSQCNLKKKNGDLLNLGCGVTDAVSVYSRQGKIFVLSVNYPASYACLESFNKDGLEQAVLAEPSDIQKMFGNDLASHPPKFIAERLFKELD